MTVRDRVIKSIEDVMKPERPDLSNGDQPLLAGVLDSLDFASVLMSLEDEFHITLSEEDTDKISTLNQIVSLIESKKN